MYTKFLLFFFQILVGVSSLYDVVSTFLCHTHTDGKDKAPGMARPFMFAALY